MVGSAIQYQIVTLFNWNCEVQGNPFNIYEWPFRTTFYCYADICRNYFLRWWLDEWSIIIWWQKLVLCKYCSSTRLQYDAIQIKALDKPFETYILLPKCSILFFQVTNRYFSLYSFFVIKNWKHNVVQFQKEYMHQNQHLKY